MIKINFYFEDVDSYFLSASSCQYNFVIFFSASSGALFQRKCATFLQTVSIGWFFKIMLQCDTVSDPQIENITISGII